jgi:hypothetical protein
MLYPLFTQALAPRPLGLDRRIVRRSAYENRYYLSDVPLYCRSLQLQGLRALASGLLFRHYDLDDT